METNNGNWQKSVPVGGTPRTIDGFLGGSRRPHRLEPLAPQVLPHVEHHLPNGPHAQSLEAQAAARAAAWAAQQQQQLVGGASSHVPGTPAIPVPQRAPAPVAQAHHAAPHLSGRQFDYPAYKPPARPTQIVRKSSSWRSRVVKGSGFLVGLVMLTGGFFAWKAYIKLHKVFHGTATVAALASDNVKPDLLKGEGSGRVNILLAGIGGAGHEGPDLTDTLLVMSVDPVNHSAVLLSIPRDMWVKQPVNYFGANQKINAVYESAKYKYLGKMDESSANSQAVQAGFNADDQILEQVLGIDINYHVLVDFKAFRQAIDTVDGVTVNVPEDLWDPTMAWENHGNPTLAKAGIQTMSGTQALIYARSRETSSDFARTERQRQILLALKAKVITAGTLSNPTKIDGLMNAFGDNVYSDLSTKGAARLFDIVKQIPDTKISSLDLVSPPHKLVTTDHVGNISVVRPVAGFNNYAAIQSFVRTELPDGYITRENAPVAVVSPTAQEATAIGAELKTYGYNVTAMQAGGSKNQPTVVVDLSHGKDPYTRHYLESRYGVKAVTTLPGGVQIAQPGTKFVILVSK